MQPSASLDIVIRSFMFYKQPRTIKIYSYIRYFGLLRWHSEQRCMVTMSTMILSSGYSLCGLSLHVLHISSWTFSTFSRFPLTSQVDTFEYVYTCVCCVLCVPFRLYYHITVYPVFTGYTPDPLQHWPGYSSYSRWMKNDHSAYSSNQNRWMRALHTLIVHKKNGRVVRNIICVLIANRNKWYLFGGKIYFSVIDCNSIAIVYQVTTGTFIVYSISYI